MEPLPIDHFLKSLKRWSSALAILTGILLVIFLWAMLIFQYGTQGNTDRSGNKNRLGDTDKDAALLGYIFEQCRRDVIALVQSGSVEAYLGQLSKDSISDEMVRLPVAAVKRSAEQWLDEHILAGERLFHRLLITDHNRHTAYDSLDRTQDSGNPSGIPDQLVTATAEGNIFVDHRDIVIASAVYINGVLSGYVAAWLNAETVYRQILVKDNWQNRFHILITDDGSASFAEALPEHIQLCGIDQIKKIHPGTPSPLKISCDGLEAEPIEYLVMMHPIANTPFNLYFLSPRPQATGTVKPWHYGVIITALFMILLILYLMHQRNNRKNTELEARYSSIQKQNAIMVRNNEDLANEVLRRKRVEAELKILNENLEEIVKHRTQKLKSALSDLQTTQSQLIQSGKLASIGELAAGIAHELNQPLMVIRGNTQLLSRMFNKSADTTTQLPSFFETVERNTKRMIMIIDHLRSFSRQSAKDFQMVDINRVINDAFLMVGEQLRLRNIEAVKTLDEDLPHIKGDPYQLEQVILNLLTNARDAIETCQPSGDRHRLKKQIEITSRLKNAGEDKVVEIIFRDTGCGIEPENMEKIFDPFFTTKEVGKGTGLGLSITYGILQEHGGHLEFLDTSPGNTTLIVFLPVKPVSQKKTDHSALGFLATG